jgi:hypothetical protein
MRPALSLWVGDSDMAESRFELPLRFKGHTSFLRTKPEAGGRWQVTTYIDGRVVGKVHCHNWRHVELYRERVLEWLKVAEGVEHLWPSAA